MDERIGEVAGKVWNHLSVGGGVRMSELPRHVNEPRDMVQRAIGWLAREDKIVVESTGTNELVRLK